MNTIVFLGPTLAREEAQRELDAVYMPPAAQGDVYRATLKRPQVIAIVDGVFERVPSVWHKEIMWAMTQGIHVFGSASMGALRAAELEAFGMEGVGEIFAAYRDGILEDDDEVAISHGPAEFDYQGQSEAMVNIRWTLAAAERDGIISPGVREVLEGLAKVLYYPDRSYSCLLQSAEPRGLSAHEIQRLRSWLPLGRVNQKRQDALTMLRLIRDRLAAGLPPKQVRFTFEHTTHWEHFKHAAIETDMTGDVVIAIENVVNELRLRGDYPHIRQAAIGRLLAIEEARRQNVHLDSRALHSTIAAFRREHGLVEPQGAENWLDANHLTPETVEQFLHDETLLRRTCASLPYDTTTYLLDHLRATGEYAQVLQRARDKQRVLETHGLQNPALATIDMTPQELFAWYLAVYQPPRVEADIHQWIERMGFSDTDAGKRTLLQEYWYRRLRSSDTRE